MQRNIFNSHISDSNFKGLFVSEMLWNNPTGATLLPEITIDTTTFRIEQIAGRSGFQILQCEVDEIPNSSVCRKLDAKIRRNAENYICIFFVPGTRHHLWVAPVKKVEKRDIVLIEYDTLDKAGFLFEKMESLSFALEDEPTIIDIIGKVQAAFLINSEKITKDFYAGFKKEHHNFATFITGIDDNLDDNDNKNKQWYTSVMLNRLMFCYFIQKKGFLDGDVDYLRHKLEWTRSREGEDRFFNKFYKGFLVNLFHNGLNAPQHNQEFEGIYGRIPYLNGGMFDIHQIEQDYAEIDIADEAFQSLFDFFDKWHWHLDDRITATGRDINPDVLGYIFEQYINDRAQMGAYYTKEDITEYIGRNTIIPYLVDATLAGLKSHPQMEKDLWQFLRCSGDRYIYDAMKKGADLPIPEEIAVGLDTTQPNLLERRSRWNERTPEAWALPTEIWRETIERLSRYRSIKEKIENGEINAINDFITYNLDIRRFVYDYLAHTPNHLFVSHFYKALQQTTILDPTCGSGAFLFAALNILEPLYEVCIGRMQEFNQANDRLFRNELAEIAQRYRSNIQYFIYKSIILRNLYGVDIMVEATEIAKLRLFLKMVAVVDADRRAPNLGLDPLPDIDFNIRCGNTLVGYATQAELERGIAFSDLFTAQEFRNKVTEEMQKVARAYDVFKTIQLRQADDMAAFAGAKGELKARLTALDELLNRQMYGAVESTTDYDAWLRSHQPFHWIAEFYEIINDRGGFDVIIGNPPYVEYKKKIKGMAVADLYALTNYKTLSCGNLYAYVMERCFALGGRCQGYIVPLASVSTPRMQELTQLMLQMSSWTSLWDERPAKLFDGVDQQLAIHLLTKEQYPVHYITGLTHWSAESRGLIFNELSYQSFTADESIAGVYPKLGSALVASVLGKCRMCSIQLPVTYSLSSEDKVFYKMAGGRYWRQFKSYTTFFSSPRSTTTSAERTLSVEAEFLPAVVCALSSTLFYLFWRSVSDCRNLTNRELNAFPLPEGIEKSKELKKLFKRFEQSLEQNKKRVTTTSAKTGEITQDFYYIRLSKPIIDEIDKILAVHYGFTEEELDFIINYDIKYRMGDELNEE